MRIKISILYIVFFCCSFLFAQELSNDEQVEQLESQSAEYLVTKIFNYNKETRFFHYPYEKSGNNFFVREESDNYEQSKRYYGIVESSIVKNSGYDYLGNETKFQITLLPILGIKAENIIFANSSDSYDGNFKLGLKIPLLNFDYFATDLDTFWSLLYFDSIKNACCIGLDIKSFFLKPFVLEGSVHLHCTDDIIPEYSAQFGVFIKSVNVFAGWKYLENNCFYLGASRYF